MTVLLYRHMMKAGLLATTMLAAPHLATAQVDTKVNTLVDGNAGTLPLPTDQFVTPTAPLSNAVQQDLNPGLPLIHPLILAAANNPLTSPASDTACANRSMGPVVDLDGFSATLLGKYIGKQYGIDQPTNSYLVKSYMTADLATGYTLGILNGRTVNLRVNINNIFDNHSLIGLNQLAGDGKTGLYWTDPGRSVFFSVSSSL